MRLANIPCAIVYSQKIAISVGSRNAENIVDSEFRNLKFTGIVTQYYQAINLRIRSVGKWKINYS